MRRALLALALTTLPLHADDGAASIGAGGLILMKREPRIAMAKEVLHISPTKVIVDYDFRNDSTDTITTTVAFPIPAYDYAAKVETYLDPGFDDFALTVDGVPTRYTIETRAFVSPKGAARRDITDLLKREHIDAATFGHLRPSHEFDVPSPDLVRAGPEARKRLTLAGALTDGEPTWTVAKKYFWTQTFPAHSTIHIRHEYSPRLGNSNSIGEPTRYTSADKLAMPEYVSVCPSPDLRATLARIGNREDAMISISYVDFILTTANTWRRPIEDFTLIVEKPSQPETPSEPAKRANFISFCWDGPVTKIDATHFSVHRTAFVPSTELRIGFIQSN